MKWRLTQYATTRLGSTCAGWGLSKRSVGPTPLLSVGFLVRARTGGLGQELPLADQEGFRLTPQEEASDSASFLLDFLYIFSTSPCAVDLHSCNSRSAKIDDRYEPRLCNDFLKESSLPQRSKRLSLFSSDKFIVNISREECISS